jgi:hypothetical protein
LEIIHVVGSERGAGDKREVPLARPDRPLAASHELYDWSFSRVVRIGPLIYLSFKVTFLKDRTLSNYQFVKLITQVVSVVIVLSPRSPTSRHTPVINAD